jgi:hypothetical protein
MQKKKAMGAAVFKLHQRHFEGYTEDGAHRHQNTGETLLAAAF